MRHSARTQHHTQTDACSPLRNTDVLPAAVMKKAAVLISVAAALALASPPPSSPPASLHLGRPLGKVSSKNPSPPRVLKEQRSAHC